MIVDEVIERWDDASGESDDEYDDPDEPIMEGSDLAILKMQGGITARMISLMSLLHLMTPLLHPMMMAFSTPVWIQV